LKYDKISSVELRQQETPCGTEVREKMDILRTSFFAAVQRMLYGLVKLTRISLLWLTALFIENSLQSKND
jgi:hypothetical protein